MKFIKLFEDFQKNVFKDKTNIPDYDDVLNDKEPRIMENVVGEIEYMTPDEYLSESGSLHGYSYEQELSILDKLKVDKYFYMMKEGVKFDIPYLDYVRKSQEGRHRVMAAKKYGINEIPVAVFKRKESSYILDLKNYREYYQFLNLLVDNYEEYYLDLVVSDEYNCFNSNRINVLIQERISNIDIEVFDMFKPLPLDICKTICILKLMRYNGGVLYDDKELVIENNIAKFKLDKGTIFNGSDFATIENEKFSDCFNITKIDYDRYLMRFK